MNTLSLKNLPALLVGIVIALAVWAAVIYPRSLDVAWNGPLKSASFAPFREGQSPLKEIFPTPEQVEEDLLRLKGIFEGVRTYTAQGGMEVVPALAAKHGFTLTHSAWLSRDKADNDKEIGVLIDTANRYPQAVKRVIVGNEVLFRRDLKPDELIANIDKVRSAIQQPVSYADVWAFWLKNPQLADHVDFITIHILPYWEDEPVSVHDAQQHMLAIIERIKQRFPGKSILVGETGWPTEGRSRGPAHANLLTAAAFVRALPHLAAEHGFDYNVVEAYDQAWKAQLEGTVGARWGLIDEARQEKFPLVGAVVPLDHAAARAGISLLLGIVVALLLLSPQHNFRSVILLSIWSQLFAAALVWAVYKSLRLAVAPASITWLSQHVLFFMADQHWLTDSSVAFWYKWLLQKLAQPFAQLWAYVLAMFSLLFACGALLWMRALALGQALPVCVRWVRSGFGWYGFAALLFAVMFSTSGRYIDIPLPQYGLPLVVALGLCLVPCCGIAQTTIANGHWVYTGCQFWNRHARLLLSVSALACLWGEVGAMMGGEDFITMHPSLKEQIPLLISSLLANHELLLWCAACVLLALPFRNVRTLPQ
ncbi:MAG: hypothetical protein IT470_07000 [Pseudomonadales bacterium]|nr:hypothetical protein [Pseudomonadales bacterium]